MLGRACTGVGSSPNKSMFGAGLATARGGPLIVPFLIEADRSSFAFSCTTFRGCYTVSEMARISGEILQHTTSSSASEPKVAGSGIGPSMTHLFESYLVRMKFSILLVELSMDRNKRLWRGTHVSEGTWPGASFASQYLVFP